jgi:serine/threonine protein kinase
VNIVQVLDHGLLANYPYYFIDMELCDLSLHDFIHRSTSCEPSESIPYFTKGGGSILQIWDIMSQIARGVEYVHSQGQVHRDITPGNGNPLSPKAKLASSVLLQKFGMETDRFWTIYRSFVKNKPTYAICQRNSWLSCPRARSY